MVVAILILLLTLFSFSANAQHAKLATEQWVKDYLDTYRYIKMDSVFYGRGLRKAYVPYLIEKKLRSLRMNVDTTDALTIMADWDFSAHPLSYDEVDSNAWNAKEDTIYLTPNYAVQTDGSGHLMASLEVTDTELSYLDGVTLPVQGQLDLLGVVDTVYAGTGIIVSPQKAKTCTVSVDTNWVRGDISDTADVVRAEFADSVSLLRSDISDTADVLRGELADSVDLLREDIADTADVLRGEMPTGESETIIVKVGDTANNKTAFEDATGLSFTPAISTLYIIEAWIRYETTATTVGINLAVNGPTSPDFVTGIWYTSVSGIARGSTFNDYDDGTPAIASPFTTDNIAKLYCMLRTGVGGGDFVIRFAAETTGTITIKDGSVLRYRIAS